MSLDGSIVVALDVAISINQQLFLFFDKKN